MRVIWSNAATRDRHNHIRRRGEDTDIESDNRTFFAIHLLRQLDKTALGEGLAAGGVSSLGVQIGISLSIILYLNQVIVSGNDACQVTSHG